MNDNDRQTILVGLRQILSQPQDCGQCDEEGCYGSHNHWQYKRAKVLFNLDEFLQQNMLMKHQLFVGISDVCTCHHLFCSHYNINSCRFVYGCQHPFHFIDIYELPYAHEQDYEIYLRCAEDDTTMFDTDQIILRDSSFSKIDFNQDEYHAMDDVHHSSECISGRCIFTICLKNPFPNYAEDEFDHLYQDIINKTFELGYKTMWVYSVQKMIDFLNDYKTCCSHLYHLIEKTYDILGGQQKRGSLP